MQKKEYRQKHKTKNEKKIKVMEDYYRRKEIRNFYREVKKGKQRK